MRGGRREGREEEEEEEERLLDEPKEGVRERLIRA